MTPHSLDSRAEKPHFWRSFALFSALSDEVLLEIGQRARPAHWQQGTVVFQRGDPGDSLMLIVSGRIRLSLLTQSGRELTLRLAEAGDTLGELALFDSEPRSADATAIEPTSGYTLSRADYESLADKNTDFPMGIARYLSRRLRETTEQLESIALYSLEARAARFFLFTLRQLNGAELPEQANLRLEISQSELATVLGASRPKVNRALSQLIEAGALQRRSDDWVCHVQRLQELAEPDGD